MEGAQHKNRETRLDSLVCWGTSSVSRILSDAVCASLMQSTSLDLNKLTFWYIPHVSMPKCWYTWSCELLGSPPTRAFGAQSLVCHCTKKNKFLPPPWGLFCGKGAWCTYMVPSNLNMMDNLKQKSFLSRWRGSRFLSRSMSKATSASLNRRTGAHSISTRGALPHTKERYTLNTIETEAWDEEGKKQKSWNGSGEFQGRLPSLMLGHLADRNYESWTGD